MKLVIDIPKRIYDVIQIRKDMTSELHESIRNGIPLEDIKAEIVEERKGYPSSADEYKTINKVLEIIDKHIGG